MADANELDESPLENKYYMIERSGGGVRYFYRARQRKEVQSTDSTQRDGIKRIKIAWQRYFFNEGEVSHPTGWFPINQLVRVGPPPYNKHISFIQTVGMPERFFSLNDEITCLDSAGRPLDAVIRGVERNYYNVVYQDTSAQSSTPYEWIHRNSARLKHKHEREKGERKETKRIFDLLRVGMYVEAIYPDGKMAKARILQKHVEPGLDEASRARDHITVQYEGNRLSQQRTISASDCQYRHILKLPKTSEEILKQANKTMHFISSLKAINLAIVEMNKEGGHSMFRALSYQLYGTETNWKAVRRMCCDHMIKHKEYYQHFIDCEFEQYIATKRKAIKHKDFYAPGDHLDLQAISELFDVGVKIYSDKASRPFENISFYSCPTSKFQTSLGLGKIILFYRGEDEYDSLVERTMQVPLKRKIGFQKVLKDLGELTSKDIKGEILKARQEEFKLWKATKLNEFKENQVYVSSYEGRWRWDQNNATSTEMSKTVSAMITQFGLSNGSISETEKRSVRIVTKTSDNNLKIVVHGKKTKEKVQWRNFFISGITEKALDLVDFCEKYFEPLKLRQTSSASVDRETIRAGNRGLRDLL
ncbi:hypothetical protein AAMO2058_000446200 [Amorphochlora amoebiformis]